MSSLTVARDIQLRVGLDVDLQRGAVKLDVNKTGDARSWALDSAVTSALAQWVKLSGLETGALLFTDEFGRPHEVDKLAKRLRGHLKAAGVERNELHNSGVNRRQLRAHDLRATFITISLATGRTESWVQDRTGHKSSLMVNKYRRASRSAEELGLGALHQLDQAIPELAPEAAQAPKIEGGGQQGGQRGDREKSPAPSEHPLNGNEIVVVAPSGLEPERGFPQGILSPRRLPFRQGATGAHD